MRQLSVALSLFILASCGGAAAPPTAPSTIDVIRQQIANAVMYDVTGTIRDDVGRPIAGLAILTGDISSKFGGRRDLVTDSDGNFRTRLPDGQYDFILFPDGYRRESLPRLVVAGGPVVYNVVLRPGVRVSGLVRDEQYGDNLAGATIEVIGGPDAGQRTTSSELVIVSTNYSFGYLLPGEIRLRATKPGYQSIERVVTATRNVQVDFVMRQLY